MLAIKNASKGSFVIDYPLNETTSNKKSSLRNEMRYALAFDGAEYHRVIDPETGYEIGQELRLKVGYDRYTAVYSIGLIRLTFNWQLLRYIQDKGWLHKCVIIYYCE